MQPEMIVETMLCIGREVWAGLSADERKNTVCGSPFEQQLTAKALEVLPFKSIQSDRNAFKLLESMSAFYSVDDDAEFLPHITLVFAAWAFQMRALLGAAAEPYDAVSRVTALIEDMEGNIIDDGDVLLVLRRIREDMVAAIPLPIAEAA